VLVGTLPPEIAGDAKWGFCEPHRDVEQSAGARGHERWSDGVDLYNGMAADVADWISPYDGLQPDEAGYREMAGLWIHRHQERLRLAALGARDRDERLR